MGKKRNVQEQTIEDDRGGETENVIIIGKEKEMKLLDHGETDKKTRNMRQEEGGKTIKGIAHKRRRNRR